MACLPVSKVHKGLSLGRSILHFSGFYSLSLSICLSASSIEMFAAANFDVYTECW